MTHPPIRRQERAVTDAQQIEAILQKCTCCRLGFNDNGEIYIVPLNFGYRWADGTCTLYFHGAPEGRKAALLKGRPHVGFELDCGYALQSAETACGYSARYLQSVFLEKIGITPKQMCRQVRFQAALRTLEKADGRTLAQIAASLGYSDQAHLSREFREFACMTPGEFRKKNEDALRAPGKPIKPSK